MNCNVLNVGLAVRRIIPYKACYQPCAYLDKKRTPLPTFRRSPGVHVTCMFIRFLSVPRKLAMSAVDKPKVVFVLGSPGAGKGTQCKNIVDEFGYVHLSAGDLLREERSKPGSQFGELIESHIRNGSIVPVAITCSLIEKAMKTSGANKFLIDGFPRNKENLTGWAENMEGKVELQAVLFLDCPEDVSAARCLNRGAQGSGRSDDNPESLKKRFHTYMNDTMPIIEHYEKQRLVRKVDTIRSPAEVFEDIKTIFKELGV